tara:strand:- start:3651 stop:3902 length:252 start_codon:yes stop_codon:yes gene_type:complete
MNEVKYPPSGALFTNEQKKSNGSPDYNGKLELSDEVCQDIISQMESEGRVPTISLVGWKKVGKKSGKPFLSVIANVFKEKEPF